MKRWTGRLVLLLLIGLAAPNALGAGAPRLEPVQGVYYGVNLAWDQDTAAAYAARLGRAPAVYVRFFRFPFAADDLVALEEFISQTAEAGGMAMITLEPFDGLASITPQVANDLATRLAAYNAVGVPVFVRFGHEMNGSWYPWSQQPAAYKAAFQLLADAVHARAPRTAMLWAPNYGGGYPFHGGQYEAQAGTPDFAALDTNGDGVLSMQDDMYTPYYPGDDAVDWAGMSLYHWGSVYPWGENEVPEDGKFAAQLRGTYVGLNGDDSSVPDFYQTFGVDRGRPIAIPETAALYNTTVGGASALIVKRAWWRQVFGAATLAELPRIKMINWFEFRKNEAEIGGALIDWTATLDPEQAGAFRDDLAASPLLYADNLGTRVYLPLLGNG